MSKTVISAVTGSAKLPLDYARPRVRDNPFIWFWMVLFALLLLMLIVLLGLLALILIGSPFDWRTAI